MGRVRVAIIGATGYSGSELVRLLLRHPETEIALITSESRHGERFSDVHRVFRGFTDMKLQTIDAVRRTKIDVVFLALPHKVSMTFVRDFGTEDFRIIDMSGDFRLRDQAAYEQWYCSPHVATDRLKDAVYGFPELYRTQIREARLVANPGCYPVSAILALAPLLKTGQIERLGIVVDSKAGFAGAGSIARPATHFPAVFDNFHAYGLLKHRHTPEMEQVLTDVAGAGVQLQFTPHMLPIDRGIFSTVYSTAVASTNSDLLRKLYIDYYAEEPFVRVVDTPPEVKNVRGSNFCDLYVTYDRRTNRIITLSVIDNLVKGAAGQAVQNMNIMCGWDETTGLDQLPLSP